VVNVPKNIGTAGETAVVRVFRHNGFPGAERRALRGTLDCGDLTGLGPLCVEVKAGKAAKTASDGQVAAWLAETETERINARAEFGILVMARSGIGAANAGRWWAVMDMGDLHALMLKRPIAEPRSGLQPVRLHLDGAIALLRRAGYGDAPTTVCDYCERSDGHSLRCGNPERPAASEPCPPGCTLPEGHRHVRATYGGDAA
jgi:hypothetical protein